jgi:hypothetical protein
LRQMHISNLERNLANADLGTASLEFLLRVHRLVNPYDGPPLTEIVQVKFIFLLKRTINWP